MQIDNITTALEGNLLNAVLHRNQAGFLKFTSAFKRHSALKDIYIKETWTHPGMWFQKHRVVQYKYQIILDTRRKLHQLNKGRRTRTVQSEITQACTLHRKPAGYPSKRKPKKSLFGGKETIATQNMQPWGAVRPIPTTKGRFFS